MRERFEQRLFRIFAQAGYSLCVQNKVLADRNKVRSGKLVEALLKEAEESGCCHE